MVRMLIEAFSGSPENARVSMMCVMCAPGLTKEESTFEDHSSGTIKK